VNPLPGRVNRWYLAGGRHYPGVRCVQPLLERRRRSLCLANDRRRSMRCRGNLDSSIWAGNRARKLRRSCPRKKQGLQAEHGEIGHAGDERRRTCQVATSSTLLPSLWPSCCAHRGEARAELRQVRCVASGRGPPKPGKLGLILLLTGIAIVLGIAIYLATLP